MRFPHPGQRFVAPYGAPPKAPVGVFACGSPTQGSVSLPILGGAPPKAPVGVFACGSPTQGSVSCFGGAPVAALACGSPAQGS
eukprot:8634531-Pyramimonas_sp.AAC.1